MQISDRGLHLIQTFEGLRLTAYQDQAGVWTIGWGHTGADAFEGNTITRARADALLLADLAEAQTAVNRRVLAHRPLTQAQFDALVSFHFNTGALAGDTGVLRKLRARRDDEVDDEMRRWVFVTDPATGAKKKSAGLIRRRNAEAVMFIDGTLVRPRDGTIEPAETTVVPDAVALPNPVRDLGFQGAAIAAAAGAVKEGLDRLSPLAGASDFIQIAVVVGIVAGVVLAAWGARRR